MCLQNPADLVILSTPDDAFGFRSALLTGGIIMLRTFRKRLLSVMLAALILISALPLSVSVAATETFNVPGISFGAFEGNTQLSGVTGSDSFRVAGTGTMYLSTYNQGTGRVTMTVDNSSSAVKKVLSFYYEPVFESTPTPGTAKIDDAVKPKAGYYTRVIDGGETVTINFSVTTVTGPFTDTFDITGITFEPEQQVSFTVVQPSYINVDMGADFDVKGGYISSYSYYELDDEYGGDDGLFTYNLDKSEESLLSGEEPVFLTAEPDAGYEFLAFVVLDSSNSIVRVLSYEDDIEYYPPVDGMRISALFVPESAAPSGNSANFKIGSYYTDTFSKAVKYTAYAPVRVIELNNTNYTLPAGTHTIPSGVTFMVPFDAEHTLYTSMPGETRNQPATGSVDQRYSLLTLATGAELVVSDGAILSLSAKHPATSMKIDYNGATSGDYSQIELSSGSRITVNGGGKLYAWGYITGEGEVNALAGAETYEFMQINDFRGGTAVMSMATSEKNNQFFFNQWYIQNIEAKLIINYGATEMVYMNIGYGGGSDSITMSTAFIGGDGAFLLDEEGSRLEKKYDPETDIMRYDMYGKASISTISISFQGVGLSTDSWYLPLNDIFITIHSGSVLNTSKKVIFLPGSGVIVEDDASINLITETAPYEDPASHEITDKTNNGSVVLADKNDPVILQYSVGDSKPFRPANFSPTRTGTRTWDTVGDAFLVNDGTITVSGGASFATTNGGSDINGSGTFVIECANTAPVLSRAAGTNISVIANALKTEAAELTNDVAGAGTVNTDDYWAPSHAVFTKEQGIWGDYRTVKIYDEDKTTLLADSGDVTLARSGLDGFLEASGIPIIPTKESDNQYTYEFDKWEVKDSAVGSVSLYKKFTRNPRTFIYRLWYTESSSTDNYTRNGNTIEITTYDKYLDVEVKYGVNLTDADKEQINALAWQSSVAEKYTMKWRCAELWTGTKNTSGITSLNKENPQEVYDIYAVITTSARKYSVAWKKYDEGNLSSSSTNAYNAVPSRNSLGTGPTGGTPYGWMNKSTGVIYNTKGGETLPMVCESGGDVIESGAVTYIAVFTFPVTWKVGDAVISTANACYNVLHTESASDHAPATAVVDGKEMLITGWTDGTTEYAAGDPLPAVTAAVTYTATGFESYYYKGKSLVLNGLIDVRIYLDLTEAEAADADVTFTYIVPETGNTVKTVTVDPVYDSTRELYYAEVSVAPAELTYRISATLSFGDVEQTYYLTGADYAAGIFSDYPASANPVSGSYYLVGTINGNNCWADNIRTSYELKANPNSDGEYMLQHILLHAGDQFKIVKYGNDGIETWYSASYDSNYGINETKCYSIYFKPNETPEGWGYINFTAVADNDASNTDKAKNVTSALMNYATKAQQYFGRNESDPANGHTYGNVYKYLDAETDGFITAAAAASPNGLAAVKAGESGADAFSSVCGMTYYGSTYILNAGATLRHYFEVTNMSKVPSSVTFTSGGRTVTAPVVVDNARYVHYDYVCSDGKGIPGAELGDAVTASFAGYDGSFTYCFADYAVNAIASDDAELAALVRAMYWYGKEAATYFSLT